MKIVVSNKNAYRNFDIDEKFEAGIELTGTEVKSIRDGRINIKESFCRFKDHELFLLKANISPYTHAKYFNHEPERKRKLLLHKRELRKLKNAVMQKGYSIIPLKVYFNTKGLAKMEIGLGKGKNIRDKREDLKNKAIKRDLEKELKGRSH
ncbi:MAG TPA: SsrA-binding protein SmpB [Thermotogota bacterium]|nr:SsrA-binding protein SmpB [Thermotogota bacterium]HPJ87627.1 SsrA-binding protein SmpB [Thermotogota bacterium]HPR94935.1 SsrA-binding protein SmpB [Thermotogota bacterium]